MDTTKEAKTKEEDIEGSRYEEPLDKGLLHASELNIKLEVSRTDAEQKGVYITLNVSQLFTDVIKQMYVVVRNVAGCVKIQHADIHVEAPGNLIANQITTIEQAKGDRNGQ